jgi:hypothetical protein
VPILRPRPPSVHRRPSRRFVPAVASLARRRLCDGGATPSVFTYAVVGFWDGIKVNLGPGVVDALGWSPPVFLDGKGGPAGIDPP